MLLEQLLLQTYEGLPSVGKNPSSSQQHPVIKLCKDMLPACGELQLNTQNTRSALSRAAIGTRQADSRAPPCPRGIRLSSFAAPVPRHAV